MIHLWYNDRLSSNQSCFWQCDTIVLRNNLKISCYNVNRFVLYSDTFFLAALAFCTTDVHQKRWNISQNDLLEES